MKKLLLLAGLVLATGLSYAQSPVVVFSQNKCKYGDLGDLRIKSKEVVAPVLNDLVQKGELLSWGVLEHSWGDEWNWNIYYVARDVPTFLSAFSTFASKTTEADPTFMEDFWNTCFEHKDAIYNETVGYTSTGPGPLVKSMTMFNMPEGYTEAQVKASLDGANQAIAKLGYMGNGYSFYKVNDDAVETEQCLVEGTWLSQEVYDIIHQSKEWQEATSKDKEMWDEILANRMYRRYHKQ